MSQENIWNRINAGETIDDLPKIYKFMKRKCMNWNDCLQAAREKFEKYFANKVNGSNYRHFISSSFSFCLFRLKIY